MSNISKDKSFSKPKPLNAYEAFLKDDFDLKPLLESRAKTGEVRKTLTKYEGEFGYAQKRHLLNRTMVGYATRHLNDLEGLTLDQAIDLIFHKPELGEPYNNYYHDFPPSRYKEKYGVEDVPPGEPFLHKPLSQEIIESEPEEAGPERVTAIDSWLYNHIYSQPTSVAWKLFIFLHNLTPFTDMNIRTKPTYYCIKLTYEGAWRNYKDYIYDVTLSPNMLEFLNLRYSKKDAPDENFAREVQELFTVGKRPFSKFTESDVKAAARLLVGWNYDERKSTIGEGYIPTILFDENNHDTGDKEFSEFYGNRIIKGKTGQAGKEELNEFFDMIFDTNEVAIHLSRKLVQFFIYPNLNDYVEQNIILPLADILRENNYEIAEALKVLLKSEYFFAEDFYKAMLKSPMEYSLGIFKEYEILTGDITLNEELNSFFEEDKNQIPEKYFSKDYRINQVFGPIRHHSLGRQGYNIGNPPSVAGWPAYYQEPVYDLIWLNSDSIKTKKGFAFEMSNRGVGMFPYWIRMNLNDFLSKFSNPSNIDTFIQEMAQIFAGTNLTNEAFDRIKKSILGESFPDYYWRDLVNAFESNPNKENYNTLYLRVTQILGQVFDLNEMHVF